MLLKIKKPLNKAEESQIKSLRRFPSQSRLSTSYKFIRFMIRTQIFPQQLRKLQQKQTNHRLNLCDRPMSTVSTMAFKNLVNQKSSLLNLTVYHHHLQVVKRIY